ncbi:MAG: methyltransferase, TrmH family [Patescibacteria group bacterium]|jgi:TrmH family RNA methyltransferase|nr:methyltransferase, TrmH family [Patescibacteria group bacterium]
MLNKAKLKLIRALSEKKFRNETMLFVVEGEKSVVELLKSDFSVDSLLVTKYFYEKYKDLIHEEVLHFDIITDTEMKRVSALQNNDTALGIAHQRGNHTLEIEKGEIAIALDDVRDPGNLGTIMRIADWYGIKKIIASNETADVWNSKTIGASMGSFTRVEIFYTDLKRFLSSTKLPILGAFLDGENVHKFNFPTEGVLLMGNESLGIKKELVDLVTKKVTIPKFGDTESLNVGVATAIILDNWKRGK